MVAYLQSYVAYSDHVMVVKSVQVLYYSLWGRFNYGSKFGESLCVIVNISSAVMSIVQVVVLMVTENIQRAGQTLQSYQCCALFVQQSYFDRTGDRLRHIVPEIGSKRPRSDGSVRIMKDREYREHWQKCQAQCDLGFNKMLDKQLRLTDLTRCDNNVNALCVILRIHNSLMW